MLIDAQKSICVKTTMLGGIDIVTHVFQHEHRKYQVIVVLIKCEGLYVVQGSYKK